MDMFHQDGAEGPQTSLRTVVSQTYEESVRDLINDERQYLRDLHMIIKVKYKIKSNRTPNIIFTGEYIFD